MPPGDVVPATAPPAHGASEGRPAWGHKATGSAGTPLASPPDEESPCVEYAGVGMFELLVLLLVGLVVGVILLIGAAYRIVAADHRSNGSWRVLSERRPPIPFTDYPMWAREHLALDDAELGLVLRHTKGECAWCDSAEEQHPVPFPVGATFELPCQYEATTYPQVTKALEKEFDELMRRWGEALWLTSHAYGPGLLGGGYISGNRPRPRFRVMPPPVDGGPKPSGKGA